MLILCCVLRMEAQVPQAVKNVVEAPYLEGGLFSLVIKEVQSGKTVYSYDTIRRMSPASVLKTVATATALELLGEDFRFPTALQYDGEIREGILHGNLYIKGSGDPSLGSSHFDADRSSFEPDRNTFVLEWIAALKKAGIKRITGSVISDESVFDTEGVSPKWTWEDMGNYYAAGCYGISVFDNLYRLSLRTGAAGSRPVIKGSSPDVSFIRFHNQLKALPVSSDSAFIIGAPYDANRFLYGVLRANKDNCVLKGDIPDPALFLANYLTGRLKKAGIGVDKRPSCYRIESEEGRWQAGGKKTLITTYSPTLREIVRVTNHVSHNLFADALLKTLGLQYKVGKNEVISSFDRGARVVHDFWKSKGLDVSGLWMYDGCGLAPADKVTAAFIGDLLVYMGTRSGVSEAFTASLPAVGVDGSVRNFLKGSALQGKARLKSGGISRVRCYAGYVTKEGKQYAVAVFANNYSCNMQQMTKELERLLLTLFQD